MLATSRNQKISNTTPSPEHDEQAAVVQWAELESRREPRLLLLFAIPNGGHRHIAVAQKLKSEGVKRGVPDLFLPVPSQGYHGLFIEMKSIVGRPSPEQKKWLEALEEQGYKAVWCRGWQVAVAEIESYLCLN